MRNLICLITLLFPIAVFAATPTVTASLHSSATVSADSVVLGDVCDLKGAAKDLTAKLAAVGIGRSPMDGVTRTLTVDDISLKLRQAGIDPSTVCFTGAKAVVISLGDQSSPATPPTPGATPIPGANPIAKPAQPTILVHCGDSITARYEDGPVLITVDATADSNGCAGDTINVRTSVSGRLLRGTVIDAQTVELRD